MNGWVISSYSVANNSNTDISIANGTRGLFFTSGGGQSGRGIIAFYASTTGATAGTTLVGDSALTITYGTNNINIENTSGAYIVIFVLANQ